MIENLVTASINDLHIFAVWVKHDNQIGLSVLYTSQTSLFTMLAQTLLRSILTSSNQLSGIAGEHLRLHVTTDAVSE